jgi:hypothetical protein
MSAQSKSIDRQGRPPSRDPHKSTSRSYAELSEAEKWEWHADTYAFRRIVLRAPLSERTSPCDPEGVWFDAELVREAECGLCERLFRRGQRSSPFRPAPPPPRDEADEALGELLYDEIEGDPESPNFGKRTGRKMTMRAILAELERVRARIMRRKLNRNDFSEDRDELRRVREAQGALPGVPSAPPAIAAAEDSV